MLHLLHARLTYVTLLLTNALDSYGGFTLSNHSKQGLIGGLGQLSHMLFRSAMNEGVVELRNNINHLVSYAFNNLNSN